RGRRRSSRAAPVWPSCARMSATTTPSFRGRRRKSTSSRKATATARRRLCTPTRSARGAIPTQAMRGLGVTGRQLCYVQALIGFDDHRVYEIHRDDELIAEIRKQAERFWKYH